MEVPEATVGEEVQIEYGREISFPEEGFTIRFSEVVGDDGRCPKDVECVWAGNAKIIIEVEETEIELNTTVDPKQGTFLSYTVELISLHPYPVSNSEIPQEEYEATLLVTEN